MHENCSLYMLLKRKYPHNINVWLIKHERFLLCVEHITRLIIPSSVPPDCFYDSKCPQFVKPTYLVSSSKKHAIFSPLVNVGESYSMNNRNQIQNQCDLYIHTYCICSILISCVFSLNYVSIYIESQFLKTNFI